MRWADQRELLDAGAIKTDGPVEDWTKEIKLTRRMMKLIAYAVAHDPLATPFED
jgi:hypothetical protein